MRFERLKDLRKDYGKSQADIAEELSITQRTYSDYEAGKTKLSAEVLIKLAEIYHTSVDYLLGLTNVREPYRK